MTKSRKFIELFSGLREKDLTDSLIASAKEKLIDYVGVAMAGVQQGELYAVLHKKLAKNKPDGPCTLLGTPWKTTAEEAAWINGVAGHSLDMDDGHRRGQGHPGVVVISAALAAAEAKGSSGMEFLTALAAGYEVYARLGTVCHPSTVGRGFHTTAVAGCPAAAVAVSKLMGFDTERMLNALGVAGLFSSGLIIVNRSGGMLKPLNAGRAASSGLRAAELAALGAEGAPDILEGKDGFFQAFSGQEIDYDFLLRPIGSSFELEGCYVKFYSACRHVHAPIDAALALRSQVDLADVKEIVITTYRTALQLTQKSALPPNIADSRFNLGFAVALALAKGSIGMDDFCPENAQLPLVKDLFGKIRMVEDGSFESREKNVRGARVAITTGKGTVTKDVLLAVGEPENKAPLEKYTDKFRDCIGPFWSAAKQQKVLEAINSIEKAKDVRPLLRMLTDAKE